MREIAPAVGLVVRGQVQITAALMDAAPQLKVIGRTGVGYDTVDIKAATERGITVTQPYNELGIASAYVAWKPRT